MSDLEIPSIRRILIIPAILFVLCMGGFIYFERFEFTKDSDVQQIVDEKMPHFLIELAQKIYGMPHLSEFDKDEDIAPLQQKVEDVHQLIGEIVRHFLYLEQLGKIGPSQFGKLVVLQKRYRELAHVLEIRDAAVFDNTLHDLYQDVYDLSYEAVNLQTKQIIKLVDQFTRDRKHRILFTIVSLMCGLALVGGLIEGLYYYRRYAERVRAAEGVNTLFAAALQSTRVGVLIRDMQQPDMPVVFVNHAFEEMTGYQLSEIPERDPNFLFGWKTDSAATSAFHRAVSLRESAMFNLMIYRKDGSPFWSEWHLSPIVGEDGTVRYFVSLFSDITKIRSDQEELVQAKKIAEQAAAVKTNFLAMMSHEIRTPINGIQGVLRLIDETDLDEEQRHLLGIAITSSKALHRIINDILDYAKMEAGKVKIINEPFVLQHLLDGVVSLAQPMVGGKAVRLDVSVLEGVPSCLMGDVGRLHQVLLNLVSNAIKFTEKGSISIRVLPLMEQDVRGNAGYLLRFEVQDTGEGISVNEQEKLFREFSQIDHSTTRRFGGTGLGLAICKRLITLLDGEIGVESQVGKGSKFWFMLPLATAEDSQLVPLEHGVLYEPELHQGKPPEQFTLLLVEDNETNRLVAGRYLEKAGFKVEEARNGKEAVAAAKNKSYDLILMDISMPEMDGMLATCHIREEGGHNASVPIIALTAHAMTGDRDMCLEVGMNDYLHKPLEYNDLLKTLVRWLDVSLPASAYRRSGGGRGGVVEQEKAPVIFDPQALDRMKDMLGPDSVIEVVDTFLSDSPERMKMLKKDDLVEVRDGAHTLKSSAGNCGLLILSAVMAELEQAAHRGEKDKVAVLCKKAPDLFKLGIDELKAYRRGI